MEIGACGAVEKIAFAVILSVSEGSAFSKRPKNAEIRPLSPNHANHVGWIDKN
jgi:hypothetical protein